MGRGRLASAMISTVDPAVLAVDLRFALETMEERSHLGLDSSDAENLRARILTRIRAIENSPSRQSEVVAIAEVPD